MRAARALADDEALHLVVGFEPKSLYEFMRSLAHTAHTEEDGGTFHVWLYRAAETPSAFGA